MGHISRNKHEINVSTVQSFKYCTVELYLH